MADIRINSLPSTATSTATDDFFAIDGATNGTRKMSAFNPVFSGASGITATDLIIGSSGPSAKSSIAARASRQGLVHDGTAGTTAIISALGTSPFTVSSVFSATSLAANNVIIDDVSGSTGILLYVNTAGQIIVVSRVSGSNLYASPAGTIVTGKLYHIAYSRGVGVFVNGVNISGVFTDSSNYTATTIRIGWAASSDSYCTGFLSIQIYNRALSAAEVVALYEAGVPAGVDYVQISDKTAISEAAVSGSTIGATSFSWTGTTPAGFFGWNLGPPNSLNSVLIKGKRYRVAFTVTSISGFSGNGLMLNSRAAGTNWYTAANQYPITAAGTYSYEFTTSASEINFGISLSMAIGSAVAGSISVTGVSVTPVGLLLAPDAGQAGGGLTWYDTSGNAANITLPASGVTWNVPTSGNVTSSADLNLRAGGTNQSIILTPVGTGGVTLQGGSSNGDVLLKLRGTSANPNGTIRWTTSTDTYTVGIGSRFNVADNGLEFLIGSTTTGMNLRSNGRLLLGTGGVDSGALLQVGTDTTTKAGGMVFGTDTFLYRSAAGCLTVNYESNYAKFRLAESGTLKAQIETANGDLYISTETAGKSVIFRTAVETTALTLDSSQNATFAGKITANGAGSTFKGTSTNDNAAAGYVGEIITSTLESGSAVSLTSATLANITSISLTAGDWDVSGVVGYSLSGATVQSFLNAMNNASAALGPTGSYTKDLVTLTTITDSALLPTPVYRFTLTSTSTVYLIGRANFTAGTVSGWGHIRARRVR